MPASPIHHLQIGDLLCRVAATPPRYAAVLAGVYGTPLLDGDAPGPADLVIGIDERPEPAGDATDALRVEPADGGFRIDSDPLRRRLALDGVVPHADMTVTQPAMAADLLAYHFWIVTNRMLLLLDRILLHAAAIETAGRVDLFCGHKGEGKSSLSVTLARAGGTLLAEDHVVLHHAGDRFLVSGCSSRVRLTAETETRLFGIVPGAEVIDAGGTAKKQFPAERYFAARPYEPRPPARLFLPRVGHALAVRPASAREALLRLVDTTAEMLRFAKREDYASFLGFLGAFARSVPAYTLELSPDLGDLAQVPALLESLDVRALS